MRTRKETPTELQKILTGRKESVMQAFDGIQNAFSTLEKAVIERQKIFTGRKKSVMQKRDGIQKEISTSLTEAVIERQQGIERIKQILDEMSVITSEIKAMTNQSHTKKDQYLAEGQKVFTRDEESVVKGYTLSTSPFTLCPPPTGQAVAASSESENMRAVIKTY